ncbi:MAG: glycosyltransferase [Gemmatimonadaceae bacterium]
MSTRGDRARAQPGPVAVGVSRRSACGRIFATPRACCKCRRKTVRSVAYTTDFSRQYDQRGGRFRGGSAPFPTSASSSRRARLAEKRIPRDLCMPTVSVVIPCFNRAGLLSEAIASVTCQTRAALELIVVDDASTDDSAAIAEGMGARVVRLSANGGTPNARNVGIHAAMGDLVAWLDSDDYWEPRHLETVAGLLDNNPSAAVASSAVRYFGNVADATRQKVWYCNVPDSGPADVLAQAFYSTPIPMSSTVVRREALIESGGFDERERTAEDFGMWLRLAARHQFIASREVTANYRFHASQTSAFPEIQWEETYQSRRRFLDELNRWGDKQRGVELEKIFARRWITDAEGAWDQGRIHWLRRLVDLAALVPGIPSDVRRKVWLRAYTPTAIVNGARICRSLARKVTAHGT